jgi:hypothetical protein
MLDETPHVTRHTSHVTRHTSHVTRHTSHVTRHTSHVTRHLGEHSQSPATLDLRGTGRVNRRSERVVRQLVPERGMPLQGEDAEQHHGHEPGNEHEAGAESWSSGVESVHETCAVNRQTHTHDTRDKNNGTGIFDVEVGGGTAEVEGERYRVQLRWQLVQPVGYKWNDEQVRS